MPSTLDLAARLSAVVSAQHEILKHATDPEAIMQCALALALQCTKAGGAAIEEGDAYRATAGSVLADPGAIPIAGSVASAPLPGSKAVLRLFSSRPHGFDDLDAYTVELLASMTEAALMVAREFQKRRASEERYKLLFEENVAGVFRTTADGRILDCNAAFADCLGYKSRDELLSRESWDLYAKRSDREAFLEVLERKRAMTNFRLRLKRKDGSELAAVVNVSLIPGERGKPQLLGTLVVDHPAA